MNGDHQNKGIGSKLMREIETYYQDKDIIKYDLFTGEKSQKNIYFYQKLGYKIYKNEKLNENIKIVFKEKLIFNKMHDGANAPFSESH